MTFFNKAKEDAALVPAFLKKTEQEVETVVVEAVDFIVQKFKDNVTKEVSSVVANLQTIITAKEKEVAKQVASLDVLNTAKTLAEAEITKAKDAIAKFTNLPPIA